jgi:anti-sigma28 factor (negative regulator of flagellin synthesis)
MSAINPVSNTSPIYSATAPKSVGAPSAPAGATPPRAADRLELSGVSDLLNTLKANNIRTDKVAAIKAQIEAGTYEDDAKLNVAIDRMMDDLVK